MRSVSFFYRLRRLWAFLRDPRTGSMPKTLAMLGAIYIISPIDLIPGLPGISWIDDALVFYVLFQIIEKLMPKDSSSAAGKSYRHNHYRAGDHTDEGDSRFINVDGRVR